MRRGEREEDEKWRRGEDETRTCFYYFDMYSKDMYSKEAAESSCMEDSLIVDTSPPVLDTYCAAGYTKYR